MIKLLSFAFVLFSVSAVFAADKKTEGKRNPASIINTDAIYVKNRSVVSSCTNRYCNEPSYVNTSIPFGMSEEVDQVISQFDYQKLYTCQARGGNVGTFYKAYSISNCQELNQRKFLEGISDKFGGG